MKHDDESQVFQEYAGVYDELYQDKDYLEECDGLINIFHRFGDSKTHHILDMGSGTGSHAILLAQRGYEVHGVDRSAEMVTIARNKSRALELSETVTFEVADLQTAKIDRIFDAVTCMFAVLSYQADNDDLYATLLNTRKHLKPGGLFIADFWYGPAVLSIRPEERVKIIERDNDRTIRIARPAMDTGKNTVTVSYHILKLQQQTLADEICEDHVMRYIFLPEIKFFLQQAGLKLLHACPFLKLDGELSDSTWNAMIIAQAV